MKTVIIVPARYGSTRLPGKPLALIAGQTMLERVVKIARAAAQNDPDVTVLVATDDARIADHAAELGVRCAMTPASCPTGTDRAAAAVKTLDFEPDFIVNLQGDAPMTPPAHVAALIASFRAAPCDALTPVIRLAWDEVDKLREAKQKTPFSGTLAVFDEKTGAAHWFSKNILPAMRKEATLRETEEKSPLYRHIGLYGYSRAMLERFVTLPEGRYEALEGLEQLRILENGYTLRCVPVELTGRPSVSGVDSPEDIARVEALIAAYGEIC